MAGKTKVLFALFLLFSLAAGMYGFQYVKERSIRDLYEDVTFMRIVTEARQHIGRIEYGINNGKQLDNFYNMQETLKGIQECSSYMEGAYVVSADARLLYQRGMAADRLTLAVPGNKTDSAGKQYTVREDGAYFYLTAPIKNRSGNAEGYLIMCIGQNAVSNSALDYNHQNRIQALIIAFEIFGVALLIMIRIKPDKKKILAFRLMMVVSIAVTTAIILDAGMVGARFYQIVDDTTTQTANKMAQALQSQVDSVVGKGVPTEKIYDLNSWLAQNSSELEIVTSLTLDKNNKITANVSQGYINGYLYKLLLHSILAVLFTVLCGLAACVLVASRYRSGPESGNFHAEKGILRV